MQFGRCIWYVCPHISQDQYGNPTRAMKTDKGIEWTFYLLNLPTKINIFVGFF